MRTCSTYWILVLALALLSCAKEETEAVRHEILAYAGEDASVKTVLNPADDSQILWSPAEHVSVFVGKKSYEYIGTNSTAAPSTTFTGPGPADLGTFIMLSPYNSQASHSSGKVRTSLPAAQTGRAGGFANGTLVLAGRSSTNSVTCKHVCGGLRFQVSRNDISAVSIRGNKGEKIAGDFLFSFGLGFGFGLNSSNTPIAEEGTEEIVTLTAPGGHFEVGKYYYIVILPTVFSDGFTLTAEAGGQVGELRFDTSINCRPGVFKNITGNLNERMTWSFPGSQPYYGPQNSFCIRPAQTLSFDIHPRLIFGSWQRSGLPVLADEANGAEVLWGGSSITSATVAGGKLTVKASGTPGSALVAIKKGSTILWSFLIWVTESAPEELELPTGKKILPPLGGNLYFQWGRKDPLKSDGASVANRGEDGLVYSIAHPQEYIKGAGSVPDWFCSTSACRDDSLWGDGGAKTVWDPCPEGYRVPSEADFTHVNLDYNYLINNFQELGYRHDNAFYPYGRTYWTRTAAEYYSTALDDASSTRFLIGQTRNIACPVRCVKE
ncbi:MAG: hypothetical protein IKT15_02085 [Firmicutes bacterium]|nr:hypothetical protein [Bacillota bacterium]